MNTHKPWLFPLILALVFLAGCANQEAAPTENGSIPTAALDAETSPTIQIITPEFTGLPVSDITGIPTHVPTVTPLLEAVETAIEKFPTSEEDPGTASPGPAVPDLDALIDPDAIFGLAEIKIFQPGPYSRLITPFRAIANLMPGPNNNVIVKLIGEDGRTLVDKTIEVKRMPDDDYPNLITELEFEIIGLAEAGRLEISVNYEFGRLKSLNSVDLILLSTGIASVNYTPEAQDRLIIQQPLADHMVTGDTLLVSGLARTNTETPLVLFIVDEEGNMVGMGSASVVIPEGSDHGLFVGEIKFSVDRPVWVRLVVGLQGPRVPGITYAESLELVVGP